MGGSLVEIGMRAIVAIVGMMAIVGGGGDEVFWHHEVGPQPSVSFRPKQWADSGTVERAKLFPIK